MKFSIKYFLSKCDQIRLVAFKISISIQNFICQNNFLNVIISIILVLGPVEIIHYVSEIVSHNFSYSLKDKNQNNSRNVIFKNIALLRNEEFWIRIFIHAKINLNLFYFSKSFVQQRFIQQSLQISEAAIADVLLKTWF